MNSGAKNEEQILKDITSGKYREHFLIYNRKSTDDTENQKNSIKYQKSENQRFAFREHLRIAPITLEGFATDGIVSEKHSGFKENLGLTFGEDNTVQYRVDRPKFYKLVELLSKKYFKGVIFLCWDRASRNKGDDTVIRKLMKMGVDIHFTLAKYEKTSSGELHMDVDSMFAVHHSRSTSEKVSKNMYFKREGGVCVYKAPVGYLNKGEMENKPIDPIRAPIIKGLFEMAQTGEWSLADLARWAIEQGLTMPPARRRRTKDEILAEEDDDIRLKIEPVSRLPTFNSIHRILTNPFYTGKVLGNDGVYLYSTSHEPIISEDVFYEVQVQLRKKKTSEHYAELLDHPLRGVIHCELCGRIYTPYVKKGILYFGARCCKDCANETKSFNFNFIAGKIGELIGKLSFTEEELVEIDARASTDIALLDARRLAKLENAERRKKKLREDLAYLNANRLSLLKTGAYTPENLVAEEARFNLELNALCDEEKASDVSMRETVNDVVKLSELLKNASAYYSFANPQEKEQIVRVVFSELSLSGNTLQYKCKKGFQALESRFITLGDPTENRTLI